ncbi:Monopolin complex, subunit Csm1/Pcs1 [Ceraceosorus bombacis]|uniref:Monopolin complex, subunit Csm1/Pcs1 n=1 Tax=Ceraceosorus bombacis TaxID=401625 RepID=A0A0P1BFB7_9BASI|nr:Monopolin complex, subunit Csm1/Pcs1 [Ceraceosorus bombacis]
MPSTAHSSRNKENVRGGTFSLQRVDSGSEASDAEQQVTKGRRNAAANKRKGQDEDEQQQHAEKGRIASRATGRARAAGTDAESRPEDRIAELEERLEQMTAEKDAVQSEFDSLRELRKSEPERALAELKRVAESRAKHQKEMINTLKIRLDTAERRVRALEADGRSAGSAHMSTTAVDDATLATVLNERDDARAEVERLQKELREEVASSQALMKQRLPSSSATAQAPVRPTSESAAHDRAIRTLYEDLTGLVINNVETFDKEKDFRRFKTVFACPGYHDLQLTLEEGASKLPSSVNSTSPASSKERKDLIYIPHIDEDRDSALLKSGMPSYLLESIKFDRNLGVKFMVKLYKGLSSK